ncbi:MAG: hypothetical protein MJ123_02565 [Lachnospiraceae bacterium]|nr:hypothetical protein [Lachnospiraceae bacterium]
MSEMKINKLHMGPAKCALDLGDGSERGEYVNQDYILNKLGRPHRAISLMYCYYPHDPKWPARVSEAYVNDGSGAWGYPYDDYFTYKGSMTEGNLENEPFKYMREIRSHGQDVLLTLTIDPKVEDEHIIAIARDLRNFGRVMLRINHEATGNWFSFNKRATYEEVAAFFAHCCELIHKEAPNVKVILCLDGFKDPNEEKMEKEDIFIDAIKAADIESVDRYLALHWGWPYDIAEEGGVNFARYSVKNIYACTKKSYTRYCEINGMKKPMVLSELNADGDVTGAYDQAQMMIDFANMVKEDPEKWLDGFTLYQMRDRGRLGLEIEDPNNKEVGIEQPLLDSYKELLFDDYFYPSMETAEEISLPQTLRWGGAEDADGLSIPVKLEADPIFCEAYFEDDLVDANLMMEINGRWFYKAPGVKCIDFMSAFYKNRLDGAKEVTLKLFAPPATGENDPSQGDDWQTNYYYEIKSLPKLRIKYKPIVETLD